MKYLLSMSYSGQVRPVLSRVTGVRLPSWTPVPPTGDVPGLAGCGSFYRATKEPCSTRRWCLRSTVRTADCRSANRGSIPLGTAFAPRCRGPAYDATNVDSMGFEFPPGYYAAMGQRMTDALLKRSMQVRVLLAAPRARRPRGEGTGFLNRRSGFEPQRAYLSPRRSTERTPRSDRENGSSILPEGIM